ncbi:hypothetical protein EG329_007353 [Mollisiaceae sp. DMI_Dod_QoI]|nr:hypothetical protein EG329_007353 [Helotiales sp. DMI_Dod_QoI]
MSGISDRLPCPTLVVSRAQLDLMSQQISRIVFTEGVTQSPPGDPSHHDQTTEDDKVDHACRSNPSSTSQTTRGTSDEEIDTSASVAEFHNACAITNEDALQHIGSQFEEVNIRNVGGEAVGGEYVTWAGPASCQSTAPQVPQREPMERYLHQPIKEDPWMAEHSFWERNHLIVEEKGLQITRGKGASSLLKI